MSNAVLRTPPAPIEVTAPPAADAAILMDVVLPVYNEIGLVDAVFNRLASFAGTHPAYRFIFVDDGSSDGTPQRLRDLISASDDASRFHLVPRPQNAGKGSVVRLGVGLSSAPTVCFMDGDLAYGPEHLTALSDALVEADVVIGSRAIGDESTVSLLRRVLGDGFNAVVRAMLSLPYRDTQAGLKGFRRDAADAIFRRQRLSGFGFDTELLFIARALGLRVSEIPAVVSADHRAKPSKVSLLRDPLRMLAEVVRVRRNDRRGYYR